MTRLGTKALAVVAGVAVVAAAVGIGWWLLRPDDDTITVTAQFDSASGLYEGNVVAVLGMPVGKITKINPRGGYVEVEFTVDRGVKVPANAQAVTVSTSILTDRQIELTPPYRGGPVLGNHDTIGLPRTKTPVEFSSVLNVLDKVTKSLEGDGHGGGPIADVLGGGAEVVNGNGEKIKAALGELSKALRLSSDGGAATREQITTIVKNLSTLFDAVASNDTKLREFASTIHQVSQIMADEDLGSGNTGHKLDQLIQRAGDLLGANRDNIKHAVLSGNDTLKTVTDQRRDLAELLDLAPLVADNAYNMIDRANGSVRARFLTDRLLFDSQYTKEICNLMGLRQLLQHRHDPGLRPGLRADLCARRPGRHGTEMTATGARGRLTALAAAMAVTTAVTMATAGCATNGLASLPLPAPGLGSGGYSLNAVFSNALNLPMNAKVKLAGADVGQLESMVARNYTALTRLRIRDGVQLPRGSTAELRTATPLGDVFVALKPPPGDHDAPLLKNGDTIGLDSTAAAATVESVLSSAAVLVNGGAVRNFTNIINGFGKATGDQGQAFGDMIRKSNELLGTLDARSDQISAALTQLSTLADQLDAKNHTITDLMTAAGPATSALADNTSELSEVAQQVGDTSRLLARFPALGGTDTSGRSMIRDLNTIAGAANDVAVSPDTSWQSINRLIPALVKSTAGNSISVNVSVDKIMLGSLPDIGFPGDIGLHGPHHYNVNLLVGTLKYTLWRLQERVVGRGPNSPQVPVVPDPTIPGQIDVAPGPIPPQPGSPP